MKERMQLGSVLSQLLHRKMRTFLHFVLCNYSFGMKSRDAAINLSTILYTMYMYNMLNAGQVQ
uniref:Uncharacterized protein n=1 Tax=Rhizophora mucronata TaxID=61149 RepID=A0A2P2IQU2_RHIMU